MGQSGTCEASIDSLCQSTIIYIISAVTATAFDFFVTCLFGFLSCLFLMILDCSCPFLFLCIYTIFHNLKARNIQAILSVERCPLGAMPRNAGLRKVSSDLWCQIRQFCKAKAVSQMVSEKERLWPRACDVSCRRGVMLGYGWTPESDREVRCDEMIHIYIYI